MSEHELKVYLSKVKLSPLTPHTVVDHKALRHELMTVRANGYAISMEDRIIGLAGISAPIFDRTGSAYAAITVGGRADRLDANTFKSWAPSMKEAARKITELSGGHRPT
jgi:IclR family acetate operon transcriptional repressor